MARLHNYRHSIITKLAVLFILVQDCATTDRHNRPVSDGVDKTGEILRRTLPAYNIAVTSVDAITSQSICKNELAIFKDAVDEKMLWALKTLDSSGEPKPGFVYGNNYWLGSRSQCLDSGNRNPFILQAQVMLNNTKKRDPSQEFPPFGLNYFVAHFRHNSSLQYHVRLPNEDLISLGLCLPASCAPNELGTILKAIFQEKSLIIGELYSTDFDLVEVRDLRDDHSWLLDTRVILIKVILLLIVVLMVIGTTYDMALRRKQKMILRRKQADIYENNNEIIKLKIVDDVEAATEIKVQKPETGAFGKFLICFSVYTNSNIIFSTKLSSDSVAPIHGLRFLGMVWIIMIHTIFYMSDYADNKPWSWRMAEGFAVQIISNSTLSVDTFFFLSGFLVAYMYLNNHKNDKKSPTCCFRVSEFFVTVLRRFVRLTPAYMLVVGILHLNATWYGKTSQFYMTERPHDVCEKYWWRNILYINNLFGRDTMCMSWSWYLSNDMQFFVITMFILILSSVLFHTAVMLLLLLLISSVIVTGYIAYHYKYVPTMDQQYHMLEVLYDPPWTRIGPYLVGVMTAYIVVKLDGKLPMKRRSVITCWMFSSMCNLVVLFGLYEKQISVLSSAVYVAFSRTAWAVGLAWLLVACCTNHAGIINKVLCFKAWVPLSRLTYCAYLLNPFLINSVYLFGESSVHVDFLPNSATFLGNLMITYMSSYVLSLMVETPTVLIMRTFINIRKR